MSGQFHTLAMFSKHFLANFLSLEKGLNTHQPFPQLQIVYFCRKVYIPPEDYIGAGNQKIGDLDDRETKHFCDTFEKEKNGQHKFKTGSNKSVLKCFFFW